LAVVWGVLDTINKTDSIPAPSDASTMIDKLAPWVKIDNTANKITAATPAIELRHQDKFKNLGSIAEVVNT
jgi:hypothetical protein